MCVGSGMLGKEMVPGFRWPCRLMVLTLSSVPRAEWSMSHWVTVAQKPGKTTVPEVLPSQGIKKLTNGADGGVIALECLDNVS